MRCTSLSPKAPTAHRWNDWRNGFVGEPTQIILSSFCDQWFSRARVKLNQSGHGGRSAYGSDQ